MAEKPSARSAPEEDHSEKTRKRLRRDNNFASPQLPVMGDRIVLFGSSSKLWADALLSTANSRKNNCSLTSDTDLMIIQALQRSIEYRQQQSGACFSGNQPIRRHVHILEKTGTPWLPPFPYHTVLLVECTPQDLRQAAHKSLTLLPAVQSVWNEYCQLVPTALPDTTTQLSVLLVICEQATPVPSSLSNASLPLSSAAVFTCWHSAEEAQRRTVSLALWKRCHLQQRCSNREPLLPVSPLLLAPLASRK